MSFSLYLHYPFCKNKCSYCDYYKEIYQGAFEKKFYQALKIETELAAEKIKGNDFEIATIFIGGGTPSISNLKYLIEWLNSLKKFFKVPDGIEFSIETNPESITPDNLQIFKDMGINRPIFGIQSFNKKLLQTLNRRHNPHDSYQAIYFANALGFNNYGVDFIFGLPGQTTRMLSDDLDQIIDLNPPHISYYQLTVEEATYLNELVASGQLKLPEHELLLAMYRGIYKQLTDAGYIRYEISSFAKPGYECQHNLRYWHGKDYLGLGPSAHSFISRHRFSNINSLTDYGDILNQGNLPRAVDESGKEERMTEAIMLGLRTSSGVSSSRFSSRFGVPLEERLNQEQYHLFIESGHLVPDKGHLRLSDEGIYLADEITRRLLK